MVPLHLTPVLGDWQVAVLSLLFLVVCVLMMLVILIQRPKGGGLSGAFGGAGSSAQAAFGAKTGDVLTWATIILFSFFVVFSIGLTFATRPAHVPTEEELAKAAAAKATVPTTPAKPAAPAGGAATPAPVPAPAPEPAPATRSSSESNP